MHWFVLGIFGCIILANISPYLGSNSGPLKPEVTVKYGAVGLICFISGLSLSIKELIRATTSFRVHIFVLTFTYVFIPVFALCITVFLNLFGVNEWILKGLVIVSCMPPPVSSAIILTRAAGGNEAAAIFISIVGSILGILITPIAVLSFLGMTAVVSITKSVITLGQTVLLPLILGQAVQYFDCIARPLHNLPLSGFGQFALLFIIFTAFCDSFTTHDAPMNASDIIITFVLEDVGVYLEDMTIIGDITGYTKELSNESSNIESAEIRLSDKDVEITYTTEVVLLQIVLLYISYHLACRFSYLYPREDIVAITFCSTHKSLTLGVPMLRILFAGYAHFSQITLPLLVYHPTQIVLGGFLAPMLKRWVHRNRSRTQDWSSESQLYKYEKSLGLHEKLNNFRLLPGLRHEDLV